MGHWAHAGNGTACAGSGWTMGSSAGAAVPGSWEGRFVGSPYPASDSIDAFLLCLDWHTPRFSLSLAWAVTLPAD